MRLWPPEAIRPPSCAASSTYLAGTSALPEQKTQMFATKGSYQALAFPGGRRPTATSSRSVAGRQEASGRRAEAWPGDLAAQPRRVARWQHGRHTNERCHAGRLLRSGLPVELDPRAPESAKIGFHSSPVCPLAAGRCWPSLSTPACGRAKPSKPCATGVSTCAIPITGDGTDPTLAGNGLAVPI
jgi:hypothetical protein